MLPPYNIKEVNKYFFFRAISWWSDLLVEETGVTGENHRPARTGLKCIGVKPND
jgi:hypothetical protein